MTIAVIGITEEGSATARLLGRELEGADVFAPIGKGALRAKVDGIFHRYDGIVFCMALGIVVRHIAPHLTDKHNDPAVVVVDNGRRFAISALSGHEGGANRLAYRIARCLGAEPVITTATESKKSLVVGIGCRKNVSGDAVRQAILSGLAEAEVTVQEVRVVATADIKQDETGLIQACESLNLPLELVASERIRRFCVPDGSRSDVAQKHLGLKGVCEPCALLAGRKAQLILKKTICGPVTVAVAREDSL